MATILFVRSEILDLRDIRKAAILCLIRTFFYFGTAFLCISLLSNIADLPGSKVLGCSIFIAGILLGLPLIDRQLRRLINRGFESHDFLTAQTSTNALIEQSHGTGDLHADFVAILQRWSGSSAIFLSDATHVAPWPSKSIPTELLTYVAEHKWTTPEILDRLSSTSSGIYDYVVDHHVAAIVCYTAQSNDRLIVAFKTRNSRRAFLSRELRETYELLRTMQLGLSFVHLSQRLRGTERLNFYAQYAPQFAHELRNSLYLPTQLLRALEAGRAIDVLSTDAQAGLERITQVDRLCDHFFNAGALFNQPIKSIGFIEALTTILERARSQFGAATSMEIQFNDPIHKSFQVRANVDLLGMALFNIIKNSVEAMATTPNPRRISLTSSLHLKKLHLAICDTGPGLPEDRRLTPFNPGMSYKGGMGLGLSIARDCVEAMGGTIGIRSTGPEGTCFEITLNCV